MKARVKATGEIVTLYGTIDSCVWVTTDFRQYWESELEFIDNDERGSDIQPIRCVWREQRRD